MESSVFIVGNNPYYRLYVMSIQQTGDSVPALPMHRWARVIQSNQITRLRHHTVAYCSPHRESDYHVAGSLSTTRRLPAVVSPVDVGPGLTTTRPFVQCCSTKGRVIVNFLRVPYRLQCVRPSKGGGFRKCIDLGDAAVRHLIALGSINLRDRPKLKSKGQKAVTPRRI